MQSRLFLVLGGLLLLGAVILNPVQAQTRDEKVRNDRKKISQDKSWFYDDLDSGLTAARNSGKPLMVVLRCIP